MKLLLHSGDIPRAQVTYESIFITITDTEVCQRLSQTFEAKKTFHHLVN